MLFSRALLIEENIQIYYYLCKTLNKRHFVREKTFFVFFSYFVHSELSLTFR